ncbi:MAG: sporulation initiation factor Spo0A C-terminal domain-containing protein [Eubacteriales bacterium]|nr:sporulation initiation factor Spo0A C-terminal domain-containing protein [Eubacteriales bacterium]
MDAPVVLIADSNPAFRQTLVELLRERYCVHCCGTGPEALALLTELRPEALVLDLMVPEIDGITLLETAGPERTPPVVLLTTPYWNSYVMEAANTLPISYVMRSPGAAAVAMRLEDLRSRRSGPSALAYVGGLLRTVDFVPTQSGARMLPLAAVLFAQDPEQSVTKELYPKVLSRMQLEAGWKKAEKDIRYAIETAWAKGHPDAWSRCLSLDHKPTNKELIVRLTEMLLAQSNDKQKISNLDYAQTP